jgi:hypothetical protein
MSDYHTLGAQRDRAQFFALLNRIATALERIAEQGEKENEEN